MVILYIYGKLYGYVRCNVWYNAGGPFLFMLMVNGKQTSSLPRNSSTTWKSSPLQLIWYPTYPPMVQVSVIKSARRFTLHFIQLVFHHYVFFQHGTSYNGYGSTLQKWAANLGTIILVGLFWSNKKIEPLQKPEVAGGFFTSGYTIANWKMQTLGNFSHSRYVFDESSCLKLFFGIIFGHKSSTSKILNPWFWYKGFSSKHYLSRWWFQPLWKILVKMEIFPK